MKHKMEKYNLIKIKALKIQLKMKPLIMKKLQTTLRLVALMKDKVKGLLHKYDSIDKY